MGGDRFIQNCDRGHVVSLADGVEHVPSFNHLTKDGMHPIEMGGGSMANEKLAASGIFASMSHGQRASEVLMRIAGGFAFNSVAGATGAVAARASALNHKIRNHAMEGESIVES